MKCLLSHLAVASLTVLSTYAAAPAYLGVFTRPVDPVLGAQLDLPPGIGVVVTEIDPEGPAGALLQVNDVLHRVENQMLISHEHLRILVHTHAAGDEVSLHVHRRGKPVAVKAVLGERPAEWDRTLSPRPGPTPFPLRDREAELDEMREMMERMRERMRQFEVQPGPPPVPPAQLRYHDSSGGGHSSVTRSRIHVNRNGFEVTVEEVDGQRTAKVVDREGKVIFDGPINTDAERDKLPPKAREIIDDVSMRSQADPGGPVI